ncbi:hypothetical protein Emtol_1932 [Emticicia oligotrophica DSM 17448]|uniref:ATPase n=1 Tax=Emticicia oligotrophica (strain DSM 17448 / CIP 109782 / MTCC 6937 / GPTSA100-15) TaxID=929562 RepID=A0ABN4ALE0_EMTOG|nr:DUF4175 family protein [Emticicia oligotrophica]AFK03072.1 hypothetical protein Emtol_1932 [Emticicia oligotrophica DSM 17448]
MSPSVKTIFEKIDDYKRKYYKNLLIKGSLFTLALVLSTFLLLNTVEYFGRFNSTIRATLFFSFLALVIYSLFAWVIKPFLYLFHFHEPLSYEKAAQEIGKFFPEIGDRLLNTLQLAQISDSDNSLLQASIAQKTHELKFVKFADAIKIDENKKYLKYVLPPLALIMLIAAVSPKFFKSSTERIVYFQKDFAEEAPFKFKITNPELKAVKNEDFTLNLSLIGNAIPEAVYLVANDRKFKMNSVDGKNYNFTFSKVQDALDFHFLASGFKSNEFELELISRPNLLSFDVSLNYPSYLNKSNESFDNVGNLVVPEGTTVEWNFKASNTDSLYLLFENEPKHLSKDGFGDNFSYVRRMKNSSPYKIQLKNQFSANRENIDFYINVIPDKFPQIQLEQVKDTTLFNYIVLGGNINDDYGLSKFKLFYRPIRETTSNQNQAFVSLDVPFNKTQISQSFYYQFPLIELKLNPGEKVEYFLQVWDNDGVNGSKSTKTPVLTFALPSSKNYDAEIKKASEKTENMLEKLSEKSKKLKNELNNLENKLKSKKDLDFQEKKQLEDLLKKRDELMAEMKAMQEQFQQMQEKTNRFQQQSPELEKKMNQLKKLMEEIMNEDTSKMYEELKKMLEKGLDEKTVEQLEKLKNQERNMDKDIDRTLKLFKQLQMQQKIEKTANELEKLAEKQDKLSDETQKNDKEQNQQQKESKNDELKKEQEKLSKEFDDKKEQMKDIEELSKELKKDFDEQKDEQDEISDDQQNSEKQLEENQNNAASKSQKKASQKMKKMAQKMKESMKSQEMKEMDEDIDALRAILENLVKLSFDQEKIMKDFRSLNVSDPRFIKLSQEQLKIQDDAKMIEDSLYSLAKRVLQIQSFVTKEVTSMRNSMDESVKFIKERKLNIASAKQQFSMTSINNLALMLSDTFSQMQQMMANAMPGSGKSKGKKGSMPMPMGEKQEQINKGMDRLSKGGMSGREMSEQAAKLAQEQAELRRRIQQLQNELKGTDIGKKLGNELKDIEKRMDENETDLVNKRVNPDLIKRSRDIQTRLLEAEKAIQQQEEDPTRQSKTAQQFNRQSPPSMEKFMQEKQKQVELIRTVPPNYTPFYKKQTDNYFRKIK